MEFICQVFLILILALNTNSLYAQPGRYHDFSKAPFEANVDLKYFGGVYISFVGYTLKYIKERIPQRSNIFSNALLEDFHEEMRYFLNSDLRQTTFYFHENGFTALEGGELDNSMLRTYRQRFAPIGFSLAMVHSDFEYLAPVIIHEILDHIIPLEVYKKLQQETGKAPDEMASYLARLLLMSDNLDCIANSEHTCEANHILNLLKKYYYQNTEYYN